MLDMEWVAELCVETLNIDHLWWIRVLLLGHHPNIMHCMTCV